MATSKPVPVPATVNQPAAQTQTARTEPQRSMTRETASTPAKSRMPDEATKLRIQDLLNRIQDAYFDYDKHEIRDDAQKALAADAHTLSDILQQFPDYKLTVQGYCDERGSAEYNIGLGDARATKAKEYLVSLGIPGPQLLTISYGKERPVCTEANEDCWQKNRRAHITQEQATR
ncbi:MAG: OmpA family protein [Bryobacteraceae bacterium]